MSAPGGRRPEEGIALWLTDWKALGGEPWRGRRLIVTVGGALAGLVDFRVHPDGQAVKVEILLVKTAFQRRGLAGLLMDTLYAAHPTAWINHGVRTADGARWWNGYREPDPGRNIHNRPFAEWAPYFDAVEVAAQKRQLAHLNGWYGLDGHRDDAYRYGQRCEEEAARHLSAYRPAPVTYLDPAAQPLHAAVRLFLPAALHAYVHDPVQDPAGRAAALLEHLGPGNLPRTYWNTSRQAAFEDARQQDLFEGTRPGPPGTHLVFTIHTPERADLPPYDVLTSSVLFATDTDIPVDVDQMSWREAQQPHLTHTGAPPASVPTSIAPHSWRYASPTYRARYDEAGIARTPTAPATDTAVPYADRADDIQAMADRLLDAQANRTRQPPPQPTPKPTAPPAQEQHLPFRPTPGPGHGR